jgi:hypothetical protein
MNFIELPTELLFEIFSFVWYLRPELLSTCKKFYEILRDDEIYLRISAAGNKKILKFIDNFCFKNDESIESAADKNSIFIKYIARFFKINDFLFYINERKKRQRICININLSDYISHDELIKVNKENFRLKNDFKFQEKYYFNTFHIVYYFNLEALMQSQKQNLYYLINNLDLIYLRERNYKSLLDVCLITEPRWHIQILIINLNEIVEKNIEELPKIIEVFSKHLLKLIGNSNFSFYKNRYENEDKCIYTLVTKGEICNYKYIFHKNFSKFLENSGIKINLE